jgi:uncharacterized protein YaaW (UPF0174 family)
LIFFFARYWANLLEVTDLVMLDLKQMNDEIHQNLVGVSNHRTLEHVADPDIDILLRQILGEFQRTMVRDADQVLVNLIPVSIPTALSVATIRLSTNCWR